VTTDCNLRGCAPTLLGGDEHHGAGKPAAAMPGLSRAALTATRSSRTTGRPNAAMTQLRRWSCIVTKRATPTSTAASTELLGQHGADQADDRVPVREDAHRVGERVKTNLHRLHKLSANRWNDHNCALSCGNAVRMQPSMVHHRF
jgi:hypothetical protein